MLFSMFCLTGCGNKTKNEDKRIECINELKELLNIKDAARIESFDNSHLFGTYYVGGMVVFENARPKKSDYKKFSIKTVVGTDDYACMCEMLERRFNHYFDEQGSGSSFGRMPDLILLDGGKGHVAAVQELFDRMGITVPLFGMVKDDRHRTFKTA